MPVEMVMQMNRSLTFLLILLLIQIGGTAWLYYDRHEKQSLGEGDVRLLKIAAGSYDEVLLKGADGKQLKLARTNAGWIMPDYHGLAVNKAQIKRVLDALHQAKKGWAVAGTGEAASRFRVLADQFERSLELRLKGKTMQTLIFGVSPGLKEIYVRDADEQSIHVVRLTLQMLFIDPEKWMDTDLLQAGKAVTSIIGPEFELEKKEGQWVLVDNKPGEQVNNKEIQRLIRYVEFLQIEKVAEDAQSLEAIKKQAVTIHQP